MFGCLSPPLDSFGCLAISGCPRSIYWNKLHRVSLKFTLNFLGGCWGYPPSPRCVKKKKSKFTFLWVLFPQGDRNLGGLSHFPLGLGISPGGLIHSHLVLSLPSIQLRAELSLVPDSSLPLRLKGTRSTTLVPAAQILTQPYTLWAVLPLGSSKDKGTGVLCFQPAQTHLALFLRISHRHTPGQVRRGRQGTGLLPQGATC